MKTKKKPQMYAPAGTATRLFMIRFTLEEKKLLMRAAKARYQSMSAYVRMLIAVDVAELFPITKRKKS